MPPGWGEAPYKRRAPWTSHLPVKLGKGHDEGGRPGADPHLSRLLPGPFEFS